MMKRFSAAAQANIFTLLLVITSPLIGYAVHPVEAVKIYFLAWISFQLNLPERSTKKEWL